MLMPPKATAACVCAHNDVRASVGLCDACTALRGADRQQDLHTIKTEGRAGVPTGRRWVYVC